MLLMSSMAGILSSTFVDRFSRQALGIECGFVAKVIGLLANI